MNASHTAQRFIYATLAAGTCLGVTDMGLRRATNEDRYVIRELPNQAVLLAVADGLGEGGAGKHAAEMIMQTLAQRADFPTHAATADLVRLVRDLDRAVFQAAATDGSLEGMGSTLICALIQEDQLSWVHAGDSRLYLQRGGGLTQLTADQTLARFLLAEGELDPKQATGHYSHQVMDQYVGCGCCEPESGALDLAPGDLLLLCSDGVHRQIEAATLGRLLSRPTDLKSKAETLLKIALEAGGVDNITLVLAQR